MELTEILSKFPHTPPGQNAKANFMSLCQAYYLECQKGAAIDMAGGIAIKTNRSKIHTEIMEIVQKLYLASTQVLPARYGVGEAIMSYFSKM